MSYSCVENVAQLSRFKHCTGVLLKKMDTQKGC